MDEKKISSAVISRLPRYYRYLGNIMNEGIERISSKELSDRMHVTASQIRQDLNNFGGFGQQGYGYNVKYLYTEIEKILGIDTNQNVILIGAGHLAQAIANYQNYAKRGFHITALFDIDPALIGQEVGDAMIYSMDDLESYVAAHDVRIAGLCVPKAEAADVAERVIRAGIKAIWNFAHIDINVPKGVVVENVHLSESLMRLSYKAKTAAAGEEE